MSIEPQSPRTTISNKLNYKALSEKNLVFWIGGRLWEVIAYGGSSVGHMYSYRADQYFLP